jgi:hypothetical protein
MMFSNWSGLPFTTLTNVNRKCSTKPVVYWNGRTQSFNGRRLGYNLQKDFFMDPECLMGLMKDTHFALKYP